MSIKCDVSSDVMVPQEDLKDTPCIASEVQLTAAFERMVKPQDNGDNFKEKVPSMLSSFADLQSRPA
jgi:hypothetical protein